MRGRLQFALVASVRSNQTKANILLGFKFPEPSSENVVMQMPCVCFLWIVLFAL